METITLHKFSHEEYWTQEYEKFNTLLPGSRNHQNTNLFNVGSRDNPDLVVFKFKKQHINLTDEEWRKLCFSPYVHTKLKRITVVVEKVVDGDVIKKVRISRYFTVKGRKCGAKYFWKQREVVHVTFDLVNNNVYKTTTNYIGRKKNTTVTKNPFKYWKKEHLNLSEVLFDLDLSVNTVLNNLNKFIENPQYYEKRDKISVGLFKCKKALIGELAKKDFKFNSKLNKTNNLLELVSVWFTKVRGIKTPDKWMHYFTHNYPGIKPLKKKDNNLIQTILKEEGIYSKYAIKLFNTYTDIKLPSYQMMLEVLGIHLLRKLNPELLTQKYNLGWQLNMELTTREKINFVSIVNSLLDDYNFEPPNVNNVISDLVSDHLGRLKVRLIREGLDPKLKATNYDEFVEEHQEWTNLVDEINNTTIVTHIYGKDFLNHIQQPLTIGNKTMTPVVLRDTYEYRDESTIQSNCVKSYIEYKDTCVISLREGKNRITTEFNPRGKNKIMTNVQSRTRFNGVVPEDLQPFIDLLNLKMKESSKEGIYQKHQVIKECSLTGKLENVRQRGRYQLLNDDLPF